MLQNCLGNERFYYGSRQTKRFSVKPKVLHKQEKKDVEFQLKKFSFISNIEPFFNQESQFDQHPRSSLNDKGGGFVAQVAGSSPTPCKAKPGIEVEKGRGVGPLFTSLEGCDWSKGRVTYGLLDYQKEKQNTNPLSRAILLFFWPQNLAEKRDKPKLPGKQRCSKRKCIADQLL